MTLHRVRDEKDWDYIGPTKGIVVYLHVNCEPVRLEFDRDLYIQEFTKTQFAGVHVHVQALKLFKAVQPLFLHLSVEDEAEYWETRNTQTLTEHFETVMKGIEAELRKSPSGRTKVRIPSGRIVDLIT